MAVGCLNDPTNSVCSRIDRDLRYCSDNGLYSLRAHQDNFFETKAKELILDNKRSRNNQYIFNSICVVISLACVGATAILIIQVIKDKNMVLLIFAEITKEEINKAIKQARLFSIHSARFKLCHIRESKGTQEGYWEVLKREYKVKEENEEQDVKSFLELDANQKLKEEEPTEQLKNAKRKALFLQME